MLTRDDLQKFAPRPLSGERAANWDVYIKALEEHAGTLCAEFGIDTALELQHFMAQIAHESGGFTILWEDMRYSAPRIMEIFGVGRHSARITASEARDLAGHPKELAERVYGLGNPRKAQELGNREACDGYRYRGFGPMQITGRADHEKYLNGDSSPYAALRGAFAEWDAKNCNELAARDDIKSITKRINGGYNGFESRKKYLAKAKSIWPLFPGSDGPQISKTEIVQVSTKAQAANAVVGVAKATVATAAIAEAADPLAKATEQLTTINTFTAALATFAGFLKAHALLGIIIIGLLLWWFGGHIIKKIIADFKSGRYSPSKGVQS